jgi:regulatory protein
VPMGYRIHQSSGNEAPLELARRALQHRERSSAELARWLAGRGLAAEEIEETVEQLEELGELDDARFARRYAEDKRELAGWGAQRIRGALLERGVPPEHIEAALAADGPQQQAERAAALLVRRGDPLTSERDRARALGYLTRKGYPYEIAHEAIRSFERDWDQLPGR